MFSFFKKKPQGDVVTFAIDGMHCTSCSINIDGLLEETPGVITANTHYAKAKTVVEFDAQKVDSNALKRAIESLGYTVKNV